MMPLARIVIADDEPLARERLRRLLRAETEAQLVGEARNGPEAVALIRERQPHIAVLDIRLPGFDAFAVLGKLGRDVPPAVIFVTAFGDYALEAFRAGAVDYLLKPFEPQRLREALRRARHRCADTLWPTPVPALSEPALPDRISLKVKGLIHILALHEVEHLLAANNRCEVFTTGGPLLVGESLGALAARLPADQFVRISRFALVNLAAVVAVKTKSHGDQMLELRGGAQVTLARTCRAEVLARLGRSI